MDPVWETLLHEAQATHERVEELARFHPFPGRVTFQQTPTAHDPLCDEMCADDRLHTTSEMTPLRDALRAAGPKAMWRDTYAGTDFGATLHANFATFEVLGRDTPLKADGMRSFVIYQRSGFHYPMHHHPAEELYLIVAGEGEFHVEGQPPRHLKPGDTAFHASNQPHALTTYDSPIMAYILWRGDLATKPVWTHPEQLT